MGDNAKPKNNLKQRAYLFSLAVINFIDSLPGDFSTRIMAAQLLRSATSVGANIVESHGSGSKKDFARFFTHALKSANETKYWLGLLRDTRRVAKERINPLLGEAVELANVLAASLMTMRGKR